VRRPRDIVCGKATSSIMVNPSIHTWIKIRDEMRNPKPFLPYSSLWFYLGRLNFIFLNVMPFEEKQEGFHLHPLLISFMFLDY
jgi:hypothetical protein